MANRQIEDGFNAMREDCPEAMAGVLLPVAIEDTGHALEPDEPCGHPGCLSHITHPCEGCGRVAGHLPRQAGGG